ncbi:hypothetical protein SAMN05421637_1738 [Demequina mangrovi]|uniref:LPXTG-motif cell wall anchor domain-containing protein n=2 Tax=Demequina mangrovi TaxID=1043493 RepID=A0A1H6YUQ6_9MICO|nr:hypothetical protein SAMN05421637_1738 [Demequina mangrovi]
MIARSIATVALAGAAVLAPTAAFAETYPAPEGALTCSVTEVPVSTAFTCTGTSTDGEEAVLQATTSGEDAVIAGTVSSAVEDITSGSVTWDVTAPSEVGTIGFTLVIDGTAVDTATVNVVATSTSGGSGSLSTTGFENAGLAIGAGALLVAGAATVYIAARRRSAQSV